MEPVGAAQGRLETTPHAAHSFRVAGKKASPVGLFQGGRAALQGGTKPEEPATPQAGPWGGRGRPSRKQTSVMLFLKK